MLFARKDSALTKPMAGCELKNRCYKQGINTHVERIVGNSFSSRHPMFLKSSMYTSSKVAPYWPDHRRLKPFTSWTTIALVRACPWLYNGYTHFQSFVLGHTNAVLSYFRPSQA